MDFPVIVPGKTNQLRKSGKCPKPFHRISSNLSLNSLNQELHVWWTKIPMNQPPAFCSRSHWRSPALAPAWYMPCRVFSEVSSSHGGYPKFNGRIFWWKSVLKKLKSLWTWLKLDGLLDPNWSELDPCRGCQHLRGETCSCMFFLQSGDVLNLAAPQKIHDSSAPSPLINPASWCIRHFESFQIFEPFCWALCSIGPQQLCSLLCKTSFGQRIPTAHSTIGLRELP